jgi:hypothetical protein
VAQTTGRMRATNARHRPMVNRVFTWPHLW